MTSHSVQGEQILNCVRSEIHNVLSTMRINGRWASEERFVREIPLRLETPLIRSFKTLHQHLQDFRSINEVDAVMYLSPFLQVISLPSTNGDMTGSALLAIGKFLLYGSINEESPRGREAVNLTAEAVVRCRFESSAQYGDEVVLMRLLEVLVNLVRSPAGPYLSDLNVSRMIETCAGLSQEADHSQLLRQTAENSLAQILLTVFMRVPQLITPETVADAAALPQPAEASALLAEGSDLVALEQGTADPAPAVPVETAASVGNERTERSNPATQDSSTETPDALKSSTETPDALKSSTETPDALKSSTETPDALKSSTETPDALKSSAETTDATAREGARVSRKYDPYGVRCMVSALQLLADLAEPSANNVATRCMALRLLNVALETGGEGLACQPPEPAQLQSPLLVVLQGDLCKHLLRNSQDADLGVLALTLRVIFNLFSAVKEHLKVQLEVFLTSVHLRIAECESAPFEHKELALESLLDFCREPTLMLDLYTNYDCDVRCTNLFETLCKCLCRCAVPKPDSPVINALHTLAHEAILCVIDSIAVRCVPDDSTSPLGGLLRAASFDFDGPRTLPSAEETDQQGNEPTSADQQGNEPTSADQQSNEPPSTDQQGNEPTSADQQSNEPPSTDQHDSEEEVADRFGWLESARERTAIVLRERKVKKRRLMLAAKQFNLKPNGDHWREYAQDLGILPAPASPRDLAKFLREAPGLDKTAVGEFITEPPDRHPLSAQVLAAYLETFDFRQVRIDVALRRLLESFRLPGEAQKIERIMEAFGERYCEANPCASGKAADDGCGVFRSPDAAFVFAFAIIMLHTDLHNKNIAKDKKMTLDGFVRNVRGTNDGEDLPRPLLEAIYRGIQGQQIRMLYDPHAHLNNFQFEAEQSSAGLSSDNGATWDGVLRHSEVVAGASFTPTNMSHLVLLRAGVHERDMFSYIFDNVMHANSVVLEFSSDGRKVVQAIEGFSSLAKIAVYYDMTDIFNRIVVALSKYFERFSGNLLEAVQSHQDLVALQRTCHSIEALADANVDVFKRPCGPSPPSRPSIDSAALDESIADMEEHASHPSCLPLLVFRAMLQLPLLHGDCMRESWHNVVRTILLLNRDQLLPAALLEIDDIADAQGHPLPTAGPLSPSAELSRRGSLDSEALGPTRPVAELLSRRARDPPAGEPSKGVWTTLTAFFIAPQESFDHLRQDSRELVQATLHACSLDRLLLRSKRTSTESLTHLLHALLEPLAAEGGGEAETVLCLELLTTVALANHRRFALVWPVLRQVVHRTGARAGEGPGSQFLLERVVVMLFRLCMRMLGGPGSLSDLVASLAFLLDLPPDRAQPLAPRVASGLGTVVKVQAAYLQRSDWIVVNKLLLRYGQYPEAAAAVWDALTSQVDSGFVWESTLPSIVECCALFAAGPEPAEPSQVAALLRALSHLVLAPAFLDASPTAAEPEVRGLQTSSAEEQFQRVRESWLLVMSALVQLLDGHGAALGPVFAEVQQALVGGEQPVPEELLVDCFDKVVFPLVERARALGEECHVRALGILSGTFLHSVEGLARVTGVQMLWLRVVTCLAQDLRPDQRAMVRESALETLRNLVLVVRNLQLLDLASAGEEENVWNLTWNVVESNAPGGRKMIEEAFPETSEVSVEPINSS